MGSLNNHREKSRKKAGGIRRRWLINTFGVLCALGLVCVIVVTAIFAAYYYSAAETDLRNRTAATVEQLQSYSDQGEKAYYKACVDFARNYEASDSAEIQFLDLNGKVLASSISQWEGGKPDTTDITEAGSTREISYYRGKDAITGKRVVATCGSLRTQSGDAIGLLRYVAPTVGMDRQVGRVGLISMLALLAVMLIVLLSSNYYFRSILIPLQAIVEKAKRITSGSYGIQIETAYDDEIGELADTINEMSIKINENEKMQTEFISSLSHELRTPLTAITGWSETLLSSENLDPQTRRGMKIIHKEAGRLTEMVLDLLDFTRIQDGRMTLYIELADIRSEYEDVVYMYGSRLGQDGIVLDYQDNDDEIPEISCDPKRMRQVFLNILDNAAKHGSEGNRIETSIACENESVVVRIRDYGPGIPEDELPLVKKKFYKGSSKARGSGIGLAVCDEIVQMHGGDLILENAEGGGTLVTVVLPVSQ